jgi:class 3 adenylate cyclase
MDDVRAVMDAAGVERAALFGVSEGVPMCALFAATYPQRTTAIILYGGYAKRIFSDDYPWAPTREERQKFFQAIEHGWGGVVDLETLAPTVAHDERFKQWWATYLRRSASPKRALALARMNTEIDIRSVLPAIRVPTLLLHRSNDLDSDVRGTRWMATRIPDAKFVELKGSDHLPFVGDADAILDEVQEFLTGTRQTIMPDRVLGTLLFTDIVGSTERAAELGNQRWADLIEAHFKMLRRELERFRGNEIHTTGDGILVTFDGPARAVRCGCAMIEALRELGIEIRVGLHTGEYERIGHEIAGVAIHIAARVLSKADANQVWVTSTVKDLIAGSGIVFQDRGTHGLKGVPGEWHLYQVRSC